MARSRDVGRAALRVTEPDLWIYDASLLGGPGPAQPRLVWRTEVTAEPTDAIREIVLVDARRGNVTLSIDQIAEAKDRKVCNNNNDATKDYPCTGSYARVEGGAASGVADVDHAYDFSGHTYDFFFDRFGRDSLDGAGMSLLSTVNYCHPDDTCPYANAFWEGTQMVYGEGFAAADDVVGHELAHGFTDHTSSLFYYYQAGAINESLSDVFGELIDLTNGTGTDDATSRWKLGEDIPSIGAIRDMEDPTLFGDPDKMTSANYWSNAGDSGGVHINSGVNNKATYLMVDGDTFNGKTVTAIGIDKTARIYYDTATNLLTSGSDYADLYDYLQQACTNLIGDKEGVTSTDCAEVKDAVDATEMNLQPLTGVAATDAPICDTPGQVPNDHFFDDVEASMNSKWTTTGTADVWFAPQTTYPGIAFGWDPSYSKSGNQNIYGDDFTTFVDASLQTTNPVTVPPGAYMHFAHAYGLDDEGGTYYDGGVIEYSTDGSTWSDAGSLFTHNGYDGTLESGFGNVLEARNAFAGDSYGYISSRLNLSSLAGQSVRFRFRLGTDESIYDYGWFIDDVRIYTCTSDLTAPETTITAEPAGATAARTATFDFSANESNSTFECKLDDGAYARCYGPKHYANLTAGSHTFWVRAIDAAGNIDQTPDSSIWSIDTTAPSASIGGSALNQPIQRSNVFGVSWSGTDDFAGVDSYDVRYRKGSAGGTIGTTYTNWRTDVSSTSANFTGSAGYAYCFSVRAEDAVANVSAWSAERCTAVPANNTQMVHKGKWAKKKASGYYLNTFSESSKKGSYLTLKVNAKRLALVATKCKGCGTVKVFLGSMLLKKISLASTKTLKKQLIAVSSFTTARSGTVKVLVITAGKPVRIEGLGVGKT